MPLRELGSKTYEESRVERQQQLDRDRAVEQRARQKSWDWREYCDLHRDSGAVVPDKQVTVRRKKRRKRARKRWQRCAMGVGRRREQIQKIGFLKIYGAKMSSRVFMQWGFTVWSWWLLWARSVANKVQDYAKSETFLECSIGLWTEQGLPVVTPEDAEYGRKGLPAEQRWLVSTEELDRVREQLEGWDPFRWWLKAQWTQSVGEVLVHAFKKTKK